MVAIKDAAGLFSPLADERTRLASRLKQHCRETIGDQDNQLAAAIRNLPSDKYITIHEGTVNYTISAGGAASPHAAGYLVPGYGGGDRHLALLEGGEAVVPKHLTAAVAPFLKAHGVPGFASGTTSVPSIITGGTTKEAKAAIAQDMAMLARFFPNAPIPAPAAAPPQFLGEWMPSSMLGLGASPARTPTGSSGGGTATLEASQPVHVVVKLDGNDVWRSEQRHTLRYNLRNNGIATGLQKPR